MVEYWQKLFCNSRYISTDNNNCNYNILADAYNIKNIYMFAVINDVIAYIFNAIVFTIIFSFCIFLMIGNIEDIRKPFTISKGIVDLLLEKEKKPNCKNPKIFAEKIIITFKDI